VTAADRSDLVLAAAATTARCGARQHFKLAHLYRLTGNRAKAAAFLALAGQERRKLAAARRGTLGHVPHLGLAADNYPNRPGW
jgi:hypothetical protein